jgi:hypothetical protein
VTIDQHVSAAGDPAAIDSEKSTMPDKREEIDAQAAAQWDGDQNGRIDEDARPDDLSSFVRRQSSATGGRSTVPPLPMEIWPDPVKRLIDETAQAMGVPPELVAVPLLVFAGATIGHSRSILAKASWEEFPALFAAVVAEPGSGKTPALKAAQHPLVVLQEEAFDADQTERAARETAGISADA